MRRSPARVHPRGPVPRLRLFVVLGLLGAWFLRWTTVQTATGVTLEHGPARTGAAGALALVGAWGLAATAALARDAQGLVRGALATEIAVAALTSVGLAVGHPSLTAPPGAGLVFAGLGLLAGLQLVVSSASDARSREIATIRGAAAVMTAVLLGIAGVGWAAGTALLLGASALLVGRSARDTSARRGVEGLSLVLALLLLVAPWLPSTITTPSVERAGVYEGLYLWVLLSSALALLAVLSFPFRDEAR